MAKMIVVVASLCVLVYIACVPFVPALLRDYQALEQARSELESLRQEYNTRLALKAQQDRDYQMGKDAIWEQLYGEARGYLMNRLARLALTGGMILAVLISLIGLVLGLKVGLKYLAIRHIRDQKRTVQENLVLYEVTTRHIHQTFPPRSIDLRN